MSGQVAARKAEASCRIDQTLFHSNNGSGGGLTTAGLVLVCDRKLTRLTNAPERIFCPLLFAPLAWHGLAWLGYNPPVQDLDKIDNFMLFSFCAVITM